MSLHMYYISGGKEGAFRTKRYGNILGDIVSGSQRDIGGQRPGKMLSRDIETIRRISGDRGVQYQDTQIGY